MSARLVLHLGIVAVLFATTVDAAIARSATSSQSPGAAPPKPRVALVLSGGAARGLAHVGVLKVLEDLQVPIDCIAGTSMGAIVGGLYAAGYSPDELEDIIGDLDWNSLIRDRPDRRRLPYRRKVDDLTYVSRWELGVSSHGLELPSGLVAGHRLGVALQLLGLRAVGITEFDQLPIRFRAVATDPTAGESVVIARGDLAKALRASMAVPGLFAPVELDGRLLVDGGLIDNLPLEAARSMGAETFIAVDLGEPFADRERPDSVAGVLAQSLDILGRRVVERALAEADVAILPEVDGFGSLDFHRGVDLIELGASAAAKHASALRRFSVDDAEWSRYLRRQRRATPKLSLRQVVLHGLDGAARSRGGELVRSRPGRDLDPTELARDLDRIWQSGEFEAVEFEVEPSGDGTWDLEVTARPKAWGPNFLRTGLTLATDLEGTSWFDLLGAVTFTHIGRLDAEAKVLVQAGEDPLLGIEFYLPISSSGAPFAAAGVYESQVRAPVPLDDRLVQYRFVEVRGTLDLGVAFGRFGEARIGIRRDDIRGRPFGEGSHEAPDGDATDAGTRLQAVFDQLDRVNFPRRGVLLTGEYFDSSRRLGADDSYRRLDLQGVAAWTAGRHTVLSLFHGTSALGGALPDRDRVGLGGLFQLSGLPPGRVTGNYSSVASLLYLFRVGRAPKFTDGIYAGASAEAGNAWERISDASTDDLRWSWSVAVAADTPVGPVYLAHGRTKSGEDALYFYVGRSF